MEGLRATDVVGQPGGHGETLLQHFGALGGVTAIEEQDAEAALDRPEQPEVLLGLEQDRRLLEVHPGLIESLLPLMRHAEVEVQQTERSHVADWLEALQGRLEALERLRRQAQIRVGPAEVGQQPAFELGVDRRRGAKGFYASGEGIAGGRQIALPEGEKPGGTRHTRDQVRPPQRTCQRPSPIEMVPGEIELSEACESLPHPDVNHPTFPNPVRGVDDPQGGFALQTAGWGTFELIGFVYTKDGKKRKLTHQLQLFAEPPAGVSG